MWSPWEISPALSRKLEKSSLILRKSGQVVGIFWRNFSFKMHLLSFSRRKNPKFLPSWPVFLVLQMNVYQSALIPRKFPCPDKFLVNSAKFLRTLFLAPLVAAPSKSTSRKIQNVLPCSLPNFAGYNPKSRDLFYTVCLVYRAIYRVLYEKDS